MGFRNYSGLLKRLFSGLLGRLIPSLLFILVGHLVFNKIEQTIVSEYENRGNQVGSRLAISTRQAMWDLDTNQLSEIVKAELDPLEIASITILDGDTNAPTELLRRENPHLVRSNRLRTYEHPIRRKNTQIGVVQVQTSDEEVRARLNWILLVTGLAVISLGITCYGLIYYFQQLEISRNEALRLAGAKSAFLANMSHEIRTPMNGIIGLVNLVLDSELGDEQREYLTMVSQSARSLTTIINDILDVSKLDSGKVEFENSPFSIISCIKAVNALIQPAIMKKSIAYRFEIAKDVPQVLIGDTTRLGQVLTNLIGNAVKFTPTGGLITLSVDVVDKSDRDTTIGFKVTDNGIGIPPEKQQIIFEPFTQADSSTTRQFGGTGLGLAITSRIVSQMGGKIGVSSKPKCGSTFTFTGRFGIVQKMANAEATAIQAECEDPRSDTTNRESISGLRILVAEDNPMNQKLISNLLKKRGHTVAIANDGHEAVAKFQQETFDLILMDWQMPILNGLEATTQIRASEKDRSSRTPIIALTANALNGDREKCIEAGMDDYISKPISSNELFNKIEKSFSKPS